MERDFDEWFAAAYPRTVRSLTVLIGDSDIAADSTSEAFTRAFARWTRVRRMEAPTGWVHRVALNVARRRLRRSALEQRIGWSQAEAHHGLVTSDETAAVDVREAVATLPQRQRTAVVLRYVGHLTQAEIAEAMGIAPGTVAATLHAARRTLAVLLRVDDAPSEAHHG